MIQITNYKGNYKELDIELSEFTAACQEIDTET